MNHSTGFVSTVALIAAKAAQDGLDHEEAVDFAWFSVDTPGDASIDDEDYRAHRRLWAGQDAAPDAALDPGTSLYVTTAADAVERGVEVPAALRESWLVVQDDEVVAWAPTRIEVLSVLKSLG